MWFIEKRRPIFSKQAGRLRHKRQTETLVIQSRDKSAHDKTGTCREKAAQSY